MSGTREDEKDEDDEEDKADNDDWRRDRAARRGSISKEIQPVSVIAIVIVRVEYHREEDERLEESYNNHQARCLYPAQRLLQESAQLISTRSTVKLSVSSPQASVSRIIL